MGTLLISDWLERLLWRFPAIQTIAGVKGSYSNFWGFGLPALTMLNSFKEYRRLVELFGICVYV